MIHRIAELRNVLEASLATFWAASSQLFDDSDITSMTLTIFAITLVPFPVYIAGRNGRGCYSVALNRLQGGAVLKRPGFEIFRFNRPACCGQRQWRALIKRGLIG